MFELHVDSWVKSNLLSSGAKSTLSHENYKSSRVMKSCVSRLPSHFTAKSSHKLKLKWLSGLHPPTKKISRNIWIVSNLFCAYYYNITVMLSSALEARDFIITYLFLVNMIKALFTLRRHVCTAMRHSQKIKQILFRRDATWPTRCEYSQSLTSVWFDTCEYSVFKPWWTELKL